MAKTLLDWKTIHAADLEVMRANTARWVHTGLIKRPEDVRIHVRKVMSAKPPKMAHGKKARKTSHA